MRHRIALLLLCVGLVWCMDFALRRSLPHLRPVKGLSIDQTCPRPVPWVGFFAPKEIGYDDNVEWRLYYDHGFYFAIAVAHWHPSYVHQFEQWVGVRRSQIGGIYANYEETKRAALDHCAIALG